MPEIAKIVATPHYLLLGDAGPVGPVVTRAESGEKCSTVYGFSSKTCYDRFCATGDQTLRPYPLLPGHLMNEVKPDVPAIAFVAINANSSAEAELQAVSAGTLLDALQSRLEHIPMEVNLLQHGEGNEYQFEATLQ
ncbi:MAG: hypothetical protein H8E37_00900 [Planctomycetes bacterium]|nr:hypothetical protein [Planctomycetota bacterium]